MTSTIPAVPYLEAMQARGFTGDYPTINTAGGVAKSVAELDQSLGSARCPADWELYAQLSAACAIELRDSDDGTASGTRRTSYLRTEMAKAAMRGEQLYQDCVRETSGGGNGTRPTGVRSPYRHEEQHRIGHEERQYNPGNARNDSQRREGAVSFFRDAYLAQERNDLGAWERLRRHADEVVRSGEHTDRAASTGSFAGLVIPQYLVQLAALTLRAGRPFANTCTSLPLPENGMTFQIPRGTTGATTGIQATENTSVSSTDEVWANLTLNVSTAAGQQDVSRQAIERGTMTDELVYLDLAGAYAVNIDQQVLSGSGSSGQVLGVLNTSGIAQATAYGAAVTTQTFYTKVAGAISTVASTRYLPPDHVAMAPRRGAWLSAQFDSSGRPLVVPGAQAPQNSAGTGSPTGALSLLDLDRVIDANLPLSVGTGPEDQVIVYRSADLLLFEEGDGAPKELRFEQTLGQQLTIKLVSYGYFSFTAARYPQSIVVIGGNSASGFGQIAPTF